jgi:hypothetical protein
MIRLPRTALLKSFSGRLWEIPLEVYGMQPPSVSTSTPLLKGIREQFPKLLENLGIAYQTDIGAWCRSLDYKLLPMLSPDFPLLVAICGGGSSGKSTLVNTLAQEAISPTGGMAGINRRVLVATHPDNAEKKDFLSFLFEPFGTTPEPVQNISDLTVPGAPLYGVTKGMPKQVMVMDTPDFDTGARGAYVNREVARQAMETADVLIYVFTNSNYNNRDNTDFVAKMISGIGVRKAFLIYRVYPSFSEKEVVEHAMTVGRNIYGGDADECILGIYRADESNAVASGETWMDVRPVRENDPPLLDALVKMDVGELRSDLIKSIMEDVMNQADRYLEQAETSKDRLDLYRYAIATTQHHSVHEALAHFPMDRIIKRFAEIWLSTDPAHIQAMRKAGKVIGYPASAIFKAIAWTKRSFSNEPARLVQDNFKDKVESDLLHAVNGLYQKLTSDTLSVELSVTDPVSKKMKALVRNIRSSGTEALPKVEEDPLGGVNTFTVGSHPGVSLEQDHLKRRDWKATLKSVLDQRETVISLTQGIETELSDLVEEFRNRMGFVEKTRQTFSAFLNVLPATVAVTYILATGDPVGATGIKIKLSGLFGLHDLYALVAIPATTGMSKTDRNQLETVLAPIAKTWLENKSKTVHDIFEKEITGSIKSRADAVIEDAGQRIQDIREGLKLCRKAFDDINGSTEQH